MMRLKATLKRYIAFLSVLLFLLALSGTAYSYWVDQLNAEWSLPFTRQAEITITGLEAPMLPELLPEEEILEEELTDEAGTAPDSVPQQPEPAADDNDDASNNNTDEDGDLPETGDNSGIADNEGAETPAVETENNASGEATDNSSQQDSGNSSGEAADNSSQQDSGNSSGEATDNNASTESNTHAADQNAE